MIIVMKNCTTQLLFSLSLVYMVYSISPPSSLEKARNKRSLILENVLHHRFQGMKPHKDTNKRSAFDALDLDELFSDPVFHETGADNTFDRFDYNGLDLNNFHDFTELPPLENNIPPLEKDEMSNVIPGSQGPFDFQQMKNGHETYNPYNFDSAAVANAFQENAHAHYVADSLMDEFMQFIAMKEKGILDQCLELTKRG
ncbi:uncharacterized protein LOC123536855 [Mercenaria mercenaria]|uniref:uncharacterized protein LOC123536855 n=1 Tax=Mercenaria mercenaria TaxID=6596 RepID=UPI001E1D81A0|nr:uncharacterized protein LOC123536855 [Mercenaria mercenaria]XP_045176268.1 uncharacterized protein LOC123536855 [Mercenaria mercenaria]